MNSVKEYFAVKTYVQLTKEDLLARVEAQGKNSHAYSTKCRECFKRFFVSCAKVLRYIDINRGPLPTDTRWRAQSYCRNCYSNAHKEEWRRKAGEMGLSKKDIKTLEKQGTLELPVFNAAHLARKFSPVYEFLWGKWISFDYVDVTEPPESQLCDDKGFCVAYNELVMVVCTPPEDFHQYDGGVPCLCCDVNNTCRVYKSQHIVRKSILAVAHSKGTTFDALHDILLNEKEVEYQARRKYSSDGPPTLWDRDITANVDLREVNGNYGKRRGELVDKNGNRIYAGGNPSDVHSSVHARVVGK
jgi:hypothetical protein